MDAYQVVSRIAQGQLLEKIEDSLARVSADVVATGESGVVTITLKVSHLPKAGPNAVAIDEQISTRPPRRKPLGSMFYAHAGALHKEDPQQPQLEPFRVVEQTDPRTGEIRQVASGDPTVREVAP